MRTDFLAFAHSAPAEAGGLPDFLAQLAGVDTDNPPAFAAIVRSLVLKFPPESTPDLWEEPDAAAALDLADTIIGRLNAAVVSPGWNDVHLARWAVAGSLEELAELVRTAMHRDGSNVADSVGGDAVALLMEAADADPSFAAVLEANNVNFGRMRFAPYPSGSFSLPIPTPATASGPTRRATSPAGNSSALAKTSAAVPASNVEVMSRPSRPRPAAAGLAVADHAAGKVLIGGVSLSISDALKARDAITTAVVDLLRPAEGLQWVDDTADPQSSSTLIEWDGIRGKGLPESGGGLLQGAVIQVAARGPDPEAGKYIGRVYNKNGGFTEFATGADDINAAKFAVAERVRQTLAG